MLIRPLGPEDAVAFHTVRVRALRDHPEAFGRTPEEVDSVEVLAERFRRDLGSEFDFLLGAFDGDVLVGTAGCHRERSVKHRHVGYIWGMYVAPEHRRTGVGRQLLAEAVDRARRWPDLECLWLDVTTVNRRARALYASFGFRSVAVKPKSLKLGTQYYDEELMALDLRANPGG